ncbi:MAG: RpiB/LacA/LacB family sugar-phosphate isomerase [Patescibacteria group bacterium]|nr:RpiB/LacA/LacB family sugar-phosphate isomerase [Patescibacteria group bacterium]
MKIYLGTDHAGLELKNKIKEFLSKKGYEVIDCGPFEYDKNDDYPDFVGKAAEGVSKNPESRGIVLGGSGQGEAMASNKYKGVRCAVFYTPCIPPGVADIEGRKSEDPFEMIRLTREHNNANMLSFGARFLKEEDMFKAITLFLELPFPGDERHQRRINKIKAIEESR